MEEATRVLHEYAWREEQLQSEDVHPLDLESMIYAVTAACRSEFGFALYPLLALQESSSRKLMFRVLLEIPENAPSRAPQKRTLTPPQKRPYAA